MKKSAMNVRKVVFVLLSFLFAFSFFGCTAVVPAEEIKSLAWNPQGNQFLSGSFSGALGVTNTITGERRYIYRTHSPFIILVIWSPDTTRLLAVTDKTVELLDAEGNEIRIIVTNPPLTPVPYPKYGPNNINNRTAKFSPNGKKLALAGWSDGRIEILDSRAGNTELVLKGNNSKVSSISWSSDGKHLASGAWDETVRLWDTESGKEIAAFKTEIFGWINVKFSPDRKSLVWHGSETNVWLRELEGGSERKLERKEMTRSIGWNPNGKKLALLGQNSLDIWNLEKGERESSFDLRREADEVFWSPNGKYVAAISYLYGDVSIWNVQTGKRKHMNGIPFAFSPDMKYVAIGNEARPFRDF